MLKKIKLFCFVVILLFLGFVKGSFRSILLVFSQSVLSQSYVEYDLRKNKIVILFFCQPINFYELIVKF
jgi:hypothetical protein